MLTHQKIRNIAKIEQPYGVHIMKFEDLSEAQYVKEICKGLKNKWPVYLDVNSRVVPQK